MWRDRATRSCEVVMEASPNDYDDREVEPSPLAVVHSHASSNDEDQFDVFYRTQWTRLLAVCRPMVANSAVAEELVQEALFTAHRRWSKVSKLDRPDLWVRRVAVNLATSQWRRRVIEARVNRLHHAADATAAPEFPDVDDALWAAVAQLPDRQRTVVALHYVDRLTTAEIAEVLGCGASTVQSHLARARDALRRTLRPSPHDPEEGDR